MAQVPDLLDGGAVDSEKLAKEAGLHPLSTVRALRALTAFGVFREFAPGTFANSEASSLFRDGGGLRNYALFATSEQFLKSAMALGHSLEQDRPHTTTRSGRRYRRHCAITRRITRPSTGDWRRFAPMSRPRLRRHTTGLA